MKVLLIVRREDDVSWVVEAADQYTIDEWMGALPDPLQKALDDGPANTRQLWVDVPDSAFEDLWKIPTVEAKVSK